MIALRCFGILEYWNVGILENITSQNSIAFCYIISSFYFYQFLIIY